MTSIKNDSMADKTKFSGCSKENRNNDGGLGVYIHIPFCERKCLYCNFFSVTSLNLIDEYVDCLCAEIKIRGCRECGVVDSIYFGGGTPNLLNLNHVSRILNAVFLSFSVSSCVEISLEFNPKFGCYDYLKGLFQLGVNRLSVGIQSFYDFQLKKLGRLHRFCDAKSAVSDAFSVGFENVSADLLIATPGQTTVSLNSSLNALLGLNLTHVSAYVLKIEPQTYFFKNKPANLPDADETADLYLSAVEFLKDRGFEQYEISNFARLGFECVHNLKYWNLQPYLGFGPSAHSFFGGNRFFNPSDLKSYLNYEFELVDEPKIVCENFEWLMLITRLSCEITYSSLEEHGFCGKDFKNKLSVLADKGYVKLTLAGFKMTAKGFLLQNSVLTFLTD